MKRVLTDACVASYNDNLLKRAKYLGYRRILLEDLKSEIPKDLGLEVIPRATIRASSRKEARREINRVKRSVKYIGIEPENIDVARYAASAKDVMFIVVKPGMERIVDESTASLLSQKGYGFLEVRMSYLIQNNLPREKAWRYLYYTLRRAAGYGIPVVISSCAESWSSLWHPTHVVGVSSLLEVPEEKVLSWLHPLL